MARWLAFILPALAAMLAVPIFMFGDNEVTAMDAETTFDWNPAVSAHAEFPAELVYGTFTGAQDVAVNIRAGKPVNGGWGAASGLAATGPDLKPAPSDVTLRYFSYREDRFYGGIIALPADRIRALLAEGFDNQREGRQGRYATLTVGMGGGGHVSVWLDGEGHIREVATGTVPQEEIAWEDFRPESRFSRAEYVPLMLSELDMPGSVAAPDPERFARMKRRYPWRLSLVSDGPPGTLQLSFFNGERDLLNLMRPFTLRERLAAPKEARLTWTGTNGTKYAADITFNEAETLTAFERLGSAPQGPLRLELRIADTNRTVLAVLRDDARFYEFEDAIIEVFRRRD